MQHIIFPAAVMGLGDASAHALPFPSNTLFLCLFSTREVPAQRRDEVEQMGDRKQAL